MKELVILSGKGGTGKTSITAAFASLAHSNMLCDADVDAADLHLIMSPDVKETHDFVGGDNKLKNIIRWPAVFSIQKFSELFLALTGIHN